METPGYMNLEASVAKFRLLNLQEVGLLEVPPNCFSHPYHDMQLLPGNKLHNPDIFKMASSGMQASA